MWIFIWRGYGILAPVPPLLGLLAAYGLEVLGAPTVVDPCGLILGSLVTWLVGKRLNRYAASPQTKHSLYGIPMQYWGTVGAAVGGVGLVGFVVRSVIR